MRFGAVITTGVGDLVFNRAALSQAAWRTLITDARAGTAMTGIGIGDSTMLGYGSDAVEANMRKNGFLPQLAGLLSAGGAKAQANGFTGDAVKAGSPSNSQYDGRLTIGSGWTHDVWTLGGSTILATGATTSLSLAVPVNVDTFDVYVYRTGGSGSFKWNIDGSSDTTQATAGTNGVVKFSLACGSLAPHTLNLNYASGIFVYVVGISARDSTKGGMDLLNAGFGGAIASDFTANTNLWDPLKVVTAVAPRVTFICLGINHWNTGASVSTFSTDMQSIITTALASGVVALITPFPSNPADSASLATQKTFIDATKALALSNNLPMFDFWQKCGANFNAALSNDSKHPNYAGYTSEAKLVADALLAAA